MIASSAFVLAALTMTGVYMQSRDQESQDDGYTIDFTALENNAPDKSQEIAENAGLADDMTGLEDDLDYMPLEAGSSVIEIPGLTDRDDDEEENRKPAADSTVKPTTPAETAAENAVETAGTEEQESRESEGQDPQEQAVQEQAAAEAVAVQELHYAEGEGLLRPLSGETLIPFSMDKSVYFTTLDQYKRNSAMIISAAEGTTVTACAEGKVINIFKNEEIGHAVTIELGDGYQITYGQLRDIRVAVDSYVEAGDVIGSVAVPTKYYVKEGSNLYLKLTANGKPVNPEVLFQ